MNNAIVQRVIDLLRGHQKNTRGVSMHGSIHQEPYKADFFRIPVPGRFQVLVGLVS
jgi:hypothetical protein